MKIPEASPYAHMSPEEIQRYFERIAFRIFLAFILAIAGVMMQATLFLLIHWIRYGTIA